MIHRLGHLLHVDLGPPQPRLRRQTQLTRRILRVVDTEAPESGKPLWVRLDEIADPRVVNVIDRRQDRRVLEPRYGKRSPTDRENAIHHFRVDAIYVLVLDPKLDAGRMVYALVDS